jgi:two-component system sensor histidine kinase DesK
VDLLHRDLAGASDAVLAAVLREAVTNILRHSRARTCRITLTREAGQLMFEVRNDRADEPGNREGLGLRSMVERLRPLGGRLHVRRDGDWFTLSAALPVPDQAPVRA